MHLSSGRSAERGKRKIRGQYKMHHWAAKSKLILPFRCHINRQVKVSEALRHSTTRTILTWPRILILARLWCHVLRVCLAKLYLAGSAQACKSTGSQFPLIPYEQKIIRWAYEYIHGYLVACYLDLAAYLWAWFVHMQHELFTHELYMHKKMQFWCHNSQVMHFAPSVLILLVVQRR
jgi:hypothetical protein